MEIRKKKTKKKSIETIDGGWRVRFDLSAQVPSLSLSLAKTCRESRHNNKKKNFGFGILCVWEKHTENNKRETDLNERDEDDEEGRRTARITVRVILALPIVRQELVGNHLHHSVLCVFTTNKSF
jgi:hypothetical protein